MTDGTVVEFTGGKVPAALRDVAGNDNEDLSSGVRGGYSVLSIRGSRWHIKHDGEETTVLDPTTKDPVGSLKMVLLKANGSISKNFYPDGYEEGSSEPPTCYSIEGVQPDPGAPDIQAESCAICPKNVFGSRITDSGKKAKACSDSRRMAVIPEGDFNNEEYGGPMLLRVPAGSLTNLSQYGKKMKREGFPYNTIITRVSFDHSVSHPKLEFNAVRPLNDGEAEELVGLLKDMKFTDKIESVLAKDLEIVDVQAATPQKDLFEEAPSTTPAPAKKKAAVKKKAAAKPEPVAEPTPEPEAEPATSDASDGGLDDELEGILASLDNMD